MYIHYCILFSPKFYEVGVNIIPYFTNNSIVGQQVYATDKKW